MSGWDFSIIQQGYGKDIWLCITAIVILFGNSKTELTHEIFKSCSILIGSSILDMKYNHNGTISDLKRHFMTFMFYQLLGYILLMFFDGSKKLHGKYTKGLFLLYMLIMGIIYFVLNWHFLVA